MAAPFTLKTPKPRRGILSRLTGNKEGAVDEINNVFARASAIAKVTPHQIRTACEKHGVKLEKISADARSALYEKYVAFAFEDKVVTDDELAALERTQDLLQLTKAAVQRAYWDPILELFGHDVDEAISNGSLAAGDRERLSQLERDLRIPAEQAKRIYDARAGKKVEIYVAEIIEDAKISPEEETKLKAMCQSLDVDINWSGDSLETFERFKTNWKLEHGELEPVPIDINLQKKESCYATREVSWYEIRKVTKRINYSGPTARLRIMKGVYWRVGSVGVQRVSEDVMSHIDSGTVYLTNKRVVFMGSKGNKTIRLPRILDYDVHTNGVSIEKDAGKSPFLEFEDLPEQFGIVVGARAQ